MNEEIFSIWYRSILENGTLWCESSDPEEVIKMSKGISSIRYEKIVTYNHTELESWDTNETRIRR